MENNLEVLQNIMKPYFDKQTEIENKPVELQNDKVAQTDKIKEMKQERINKRKELEIELENLRIREKFAIKNFNEKKEREIEEYISQSMDSNSSFFATYGSMLRKDLEQEYDKKLQELQKGFKDQEDYLVSQIKELKSVSDEEKEEKQTLEALDNKTDFRRVDLRELVDIKENIRKQLLMEQKRLNNELNRLQVEQRIYKSSLPMELEKHQLKFNEIMYKLSNFKYEYNDQHQVINGNEWRKLYEESNLISDEIYDLKQKIAKDLTDSDEILEIKESLSKLDEYLDMTNLTDEEIKVIMMSMTPWEKVEYDRRKKVTNNDLLPDIDEISNNIDKNFKNLFENRQDVKEDIVEINDPVNSAYNESTEDLVVENELDLLQTIYNDIVKEAMELKSVRINDSKGNLKENEYYISTKKGDQEYRVRGTVDLDFGEEFDQEPLKLPCGEYVDSSDIKKALSNYYKKNKAKTYVVKQAEKSYEITRRTILKFKNKLKKCSSVFLEKQNDEFIVFGQESNSKAMPFDSKIGKIKADDFSDGEFVNRNELIISMKNLFTTKKQTWLRKLSKGLKNKKDDFLSLMNLDYTYDDMYEETYEEENIKQR